MLWECDVDRSLPTGKSSLHFNHPVLGVVQARAFVTDSEGRGSVHEALLGDGSALSSVRMHWMDLPAILPAEPLTDGRSVWAGSWEAVGAGWRLRLDKRPDLAATTRASRDSPHAVTHVGSLTRTDGATFTGDEAVNALASWQLALSFAIGRWVLPALPWGLTADGTSAWAAWLPWRSDATSGCGRSRRLTMSASLLVETC